MNEKEQKTVDHLLEKIISASPEDAERFAQALRHVTASIFNREEAEELRRRGQK